MFELWPFTNFHDLNLDWIIKTIKVYTKKVDDFIADITEAWDDFKDWVSGEIDQMHDDFAQYVNVTEGALNTGAIADGAITFEKLSAGLLPYVRPEDYGAAGDGVTDDYAALTAAFNNADGYPVWLAAGKTYLTSGTIDIDVPMFNQGEIKYTGMGIALNFKPTQNVDGMNWDLGTIRGESSNFLIMLDSTDAWMQYLNFDFDRLIGNTGNPVFYLKVVGTHWINEVRFNKGKFASGRHAVYIDDDMKTGTLFNSGYAFNEVGFEGVTYGIRLVDRVTGVVFDQCRCRESITSLLEGGGASTLVQQHVIWNGPEINWSMLGDPANYAVTVNNGIIDKSGNLRTYDKTVIRNGMAYGITWQEGMRENVSTYGAYSIVDNRQVIDMSTVYDYVGNTAVVNARPFVRTFTSSNDSSVDGYTIKIDPRMFISTSGTFGPSNEYIFILTVSPGKTVRFEKLDGTVLYTFTNSEAVTVYKNISISKSVPNYIFQIVEPIYFHS